MPTSPTWTRAAIPGALERSESLSRRSAFLAALKDTVPVIAGYVILGMGFGALMDAAGYTPLEAAAMSLFIYAGSMQYAAVSLFTGGASLITVALTTLAVNARHLFYGISMIPRWRGIGKWKPYLIYALTDETYSLVSAGEHDKGYYVTVTLLDHAYWVLGTLLGSLLSTALPVNTAGIEFALTALFITVFTDQWLKAKDHLPAILGLVVTAAARLLLGPEKFLIPAMAVLAVLLLLPRRKEAPHEP